MPDVVQVFYFNLLNSEEIFMAKRITLIKQAILKDNGIPIPGSKEEKKQFKKTQKTFARQFEKAFPDKLAEKTIVIIPSLTMDQEILSKVKGFTYYEERLLCLLLLLRMPRTHVVYVSSMPIDPIIIDYYLHLLPGITGYHAKKRLHIFNCHDTSLKSLTEKIIERPRLVERINQAIPDKSLAHMACFNVTDKERTLAVQLGIPIFGCDPDFVDLGNKSNSRKIFKECGLQPPAGFEDLYSEKEIIKALVKLKQQNPSLKKAVVKLNDGFSGDGNAVFKYENIKVNDEIEENIKLNFFTKMKTVAPDITLDMFFQKFKNMGGIVEEFVEGRVKRSPSVQCRINPDAFCEITSTHDQELGGENGQVFLGAHFPANIEYAPALGKMGKKIAIALRDKGALGKFAVDFISIKLKSRWKHYPIEINLRKGGTTHPFLMLQFLTDGEYNAEKGIYYTANGQSRYYFSSDNLRSEQFHGLTPSDLIDIAMLHELHYDGALQEGVMFHLIGALSQFGKLGVVCIGSTPEKAIEFYQKALSVLNLETVHHYT